MKKYILIGAGGFLGAVLRFGIKGIPVTGIPGHIPMNTLFINITGSFILAFILTVAAKSQSYEEELRLGIGTGFLGAYTTFSTLCKEIVLLLEQGRYTSSIFYIGFSIAFGMIAAFLGVAAARRILDRKEMKQGCIKNEKSGSKEGNTP